MGDLIRTTAELESACAAARVEGILSLDTEFVWMRTYRPQLGLVQMGCRAQCAALDCKCGMDTTALKALIEDASVVKILHDARQDLTLLHHYTGAVPANVFDTQLAAAFAGYPAGIGLQKLLMEVLDVGLAKTETCTDWLQRPLSPAQVAYALDDVRYLPILRDTLLIMADELGTRAFLDADLLHYNDVMQYEDYDAETLWRRVKTRRARLDGRGRAMLRAVVLLREQMAQKWNLPRGWLGDDASLVQMAVAGKVEHLRHRLKGGQGDTMRALYRAELERAAALPESAWPVVTRHHYLPEVEEAATRAMAWLEERAAALHVAASIIATHATVTAYIDNPDDAANPLASGWRYEEVGREMASQFYVA